MVGAPSTPRIELSGRSWRTLTADERAWVRTIQDLDGLLLAAFELDRVTLSPRPSSTSRVTSRVLQELDPKRPSHDPIVAALKPLQRAIEAIDAAPRTEVRRVHERIPAHKVREFDRRSLVKLARIPGKSTQDRIRAARSISAPRRIQSANTAENRLVRHLADTLGSSLKKRIEDEESLGRETERLAGMLRALEALDEPSSPLCRISGAGPHEPNNALISDPRYGFVWRFYRLVRSWDDRWDLLWRRREVTVMEAILWATFARLSEAPGAWVPEQPFRYEASPGGLILEGDWLHVAILNGEVDRLVSLALVTRGQGEAPRLLIRERSFASGEVAPLERSGARCRVLSASFESNEPIDTARGAKLTLYLGENDLYEAHADREGVSSISRWLAKSLDAHPATSGKSSSVFEDKRRCGVDLLGNRALLSLDHARCSGELLLTADLGEDVRASGDVAAKSHVELVGARSVWESLLSSEDETAELEERAMRAALGAYQQAGAEHLIQYTYAAPDSMDEVGLAKLWGAMPTARARWSIWRSVAAALVVSGEPSSPIEVDAPMLVLDLGSPSPTVTKLVGKYDGKEHTPEAFFWERTAPVRPTPCGDSGLFRRMEDALEELLPVREELLEREALVQRLVDAGWSFERSDDVPMRFPWRGEDGSWRIARVRCGHELSGDNSARSVQAFKEWLEDRPVARAMEGSLKRAASLRVIVIGWRGFEEGWLRHELSRQLPPDAALELLGSSAVARGCELFLDRHLGDLPTYRDMIPALHLNVKGKLVPLLDPGVVLSGVRPSQKIEWSPRARFEIPPDVSTLGLPIEVGAEDDRSCFIAHIEHETFPLQRAVRVRIETTYRYAQDAFRVMLIAEDASAPFQRIEVRWRRGASEDAFDTPTASNEPPTFEADEAWTERADVALEILIDDCFKAIQTARSSLEGGNPAARMKKTAHLREMEREVEVLLEAIAACEAQSRRVFAAARLPDIPEDRRTKIAALAQCFIDLADLERTVGERRGMPTLFRATSEKKNGALRSLLDRVRDDATRALGRLYHHAPPAAVIRLVEEVSMESRVDLFHTLGRVIRPGEGSTVAFLESFERGIAGVEDADQLTPQIEAALWMMTTALWAREGSVRGCTPALVERLQGMVARVLEELEESWLEEGLAPSVLNELGCITLALLRLRQSDEFDHLVSVDAEWSREMAARFRALQVCLLDENKSARGPRIEIGDGEQGAGFGIMVAEMLEGVRMGALRLVEE